MYKYFIKPILFLFTPEVAHHITMTLFKWLLWIPGLKKIIRLMYTIDHPALQVSLWDMKFPNPVGLAAGFDKDGKYCDVISHLGFGFIEIGTVTPRGQGGNDKPRLFRIVRDHALINRMGFNNDGVDILVKQLKHLQNKNIIIGGNIGKNKITPNEKATEDYMVCFNSLYEYVDYFVVNVSSPNTPGLRALQEPGPLTQLLTELMLENTKKTRPKPILLKIAPDLTYSQLDDIISIVLHTGIHGIIATNTTLDRSDLKTDTTSIGAGGLSGSPLTLRATEVIRYISENSDRKIPIIGVGGIMTPEDALEKLDAGASLVQVYTGLIYDGPGLVKKINRAVLKARL